MILQYIYYINYKNINKLTLEYKSVFKNSLYYIDKKIEQIE